MSKRILIVEDHADIRKLIRMTLEFESFEIHEAASADEGLEMVRQLKPDLLLLDISMDGWDGWETARQVRDRLDASKLPVIFVSANMIDNQSDKIRQALCQGFVAKPVLETELLDTLENVLKLQWIRAEPAMTAAALPPEAEPALVPLPLELHEDLMRMARQGRAPALRERLREAASTLPAEASTLAALLACLDRFDFDGLMSTLKLSQRETND